MVYKKDFRIVRVHVFLNIIIVCYVPNFSEQSCIHIVYSYTHVIL